MTAGVSAHPNGYYPGFGSTNVSGDVVEPQPSSAAELLRRGVWGTGDRRVRAIWRVLLPWPVLWFLAGSVGVAGATALVPASASQPATMLAFGLSQAAAFGVAWVAWARYVDQRPLSKYGLSVSRSWLLDLVAGFVAVLVGFGCWFAIGSSLGWADVEASTVVPETTLVFGSGAVLVAIVVNVWVQETVFFGVTLTNAAEGLSNRGVVPSRAVVGAWVVAVLIFTVKHRPPTAERALNLLLALGVFGLLYAHTGELALSIGVHAGVNYVGNAIVASPSPAGDRPAVLLVSESLPGLLGSLSEGAIPQILLAYLALLAWIRWRGGEVAFATETARWTDR